ncbi:hypothetical protein CSA56_02395 [candidate division KSB3 bacterium]|uniref:RQC P-site tRNA stabilizing factor n=1 Tax=candidate division KSB3 bacterium TaxID=2044937 RepID=A0A2G6KJT1_9BACT|nr:MAG: hypothetical protein CSA56_02395 [candidate division KSB3 bacterium]
MRLDYFLKLSRIIKRRPLAKEVCEKRLVRINDQIAKASKDVEIGDIIAISLRNRRMKVRVEQVPERAVSRKDAAALYTVLEDFHEREDDVLC